MQTRQINLVINKLTKAQYEGTTKNADELYITTDDVGLTSSDITTALGYTPYNASNPNGYTSNVGTVTKVNNVSPVNGNVTLTIPTVNDGTLTIVQGGVSKGTFTANASSDTTIALDAGGSSRNIGEIVTSTIPLTDAGLHLLDGALISGSGSYSAFVDYIADLYDSGDYTAIFDTEANWQSSVSQYGVCGKFVYDSVNNTVRLPKITGIVEGTTDLTALGDLVQAGLPNITGSVNRGNSSVGVYVAGTGALTVSNVGANYLQSGGASQNDVYKTFSINASRSSSIYGNSTTVQPQAIKVLYYIVVATSTKTSVQVDIDEIATDLNGKADTDFSNVTDAAKIAMANASMPSDTYENLTLGASGATYIAPADGWFGCTISVTAGSFNMTNTTANSAFGTMFNANAGIVKAILPVKKGDEMLLQYTAAATQTYKTLRFIYAQGSESEAQ